MFGWMSLERFWQDLRYGVRLMGRSPGFTAVAVLSLALGIGANTAIFSVFDALMLRSLPVLNPNELVSVLRTDRGRTGDTVSYPIFEKLRDMREIFAGVSAVSQTQVNLTIGGSGGEIEPGAALVDLVSGNYFSMLGVKAAIGGTFNADDDGAPGANPVTVISYDYWQRRFSRSPEALGRKLTVNKTVFTIVGVAAKGFEGELIAQPTDLWIPMAMQSQVMPERPGLLANQNSMWLRVIARLQPGMTLQKAQPPLQALYQQMLRASAGSGASPRTLQRLAEQHIALEPAGRGFAVQREFFAKPLRVLLCVVGVVLLIACVNIANLLLARSAARHKEIAMRLAIGAGRIRIVRQLLTESILLSLTGGALGLLFAVWGARFLVDLAASGRAPMHLAVPLDARMLLFTSSVCLLTGILFGLAPASDASKVSLTAALKGASGSDRFIRRFGFGKQLVISQVALSLLLLIGAGLFMRSIRNLKSQELGFDREGVLLIWTAPPRSTGPRELAKLYDVAPERISALPGVVSVSPSRNGLLSGFVGIRQVNAQGYAPAAEEDTYTQWSLVGPKFFSAVGMRLLVGRDFTPRDDETAPKVAIINEQMARDFFAGQNPIGKHFGTRGDNGYPIEVVGVVQDSKYFSLRDKNDRMMYLPYRQDLAHLTGMCLAVRTVARLASGLTGQIRDELRKIDPTLRISSVDTIGSRIDATIVEDRMLVLLSAFFGALALLLTSLGLYGLMSYIAARRTNEIGIRLALGATRASLLAMVVKETLGLAAIGIVIGVPVTVAFSRLISSLLFGIGPADPLTISTACMLMLLVAALAAFIPARRAAGVDPMVALRYE